MTYANDDTPIGIGHNHPPPDELTPFEVAAKAVHDIYDETVLWLDGQKITTQLLADGVANLLGEIRKAEALADATRKAEKAPLDAAIAEVQARYAPLIGNTKSGGKGLTLVAMDACRKALQPFLDAEDQRLRDEAQAKREAAIEAAAAAEAALRAAAPDNLAERGAAEALYSRSQRAQTAANTAAHATAKAGSIGRSTALRRTYEVSIDNAVEAARWGWAAHRDEMLAFLLSLAERDQRAGARELPGFTIVERKVAV
jgi:hypothetical protein